MIGSVRTYLEIAAALLILGAFLWYTVHERDLGEHTIELHDAAAKRVLDVTVNQQTAAAQAKADAADKRAHDAQSQLTAYMAAQPLEPIRVCVAHLGGGGLSQARTALAAPAGTGPAAAAVPPVPAGVEIGAGLEALMRSAGDLAIGLREFQQR
jgi:hypothetical protein